MKKAKHKLKLKPTQTPRVEQRFFFSGGVKRIIVRGLDLLLLYISNLIIFLLILVFRPNHSFAENFAWFNNLSPVESNYQSWRLIVFWAYLLVIYGLYFLVLTKLSHGWTLFGYLFKIRIVNETEKVSTIKLQLLRLFKKELVPLFLFPLLMLLFSIVMANLKLEQNVFLVMINMMFRQQQNDSSVALQAVSTFFSVLFWGVFLVQFLYLINTYWAQKRRSWQDSAARIYVVDFRPKKSQ
ncbi:hypothetical protein J2Z62_000569 [Mycoplasmoides fastidiosum]|uniref:RDD domain-containing protein n=1 Tax=Mycoplasmoides fastidiosum TaxID=92758 RepID=A0ABU0LZK1_9BACT|nr:RDD family protein [Mycoplasmoides fastidiosum]MDQ0514131.1 hypothetical protein [Mycoplasmoides fastidiosum]UUD37461.1 RDD family protein [Mycoplasmoides fastidiosum]